MRPESLDRGPLTVEEYLRLEESAAVRHEFVDGRVYAMTGTTIRHNVIALNVVGRLNALAAGTACRAYVIDIKLRAAADRVYYPDVILVCTPHGQDSVMIESPCLVVEVTSPSSRRTDRGEKLDAYLRMESLRGYLVVEQDRPHVTLYARDGATWRREEIVTSGSVRIPCLNREISLDDVYAGVDLTPRVREDEEGWAVAL